MSILGEEMELPRLVIVESGDEDDRRVEEESGREEISFLKQNVEEKSDGEETVEDDIGDADEDDPDFMRKLKNPMMKKRCKDFKQINKARPDRDSDLPQGLPKEDWNDYFDVFVHDGDSADAELLIAWHKICAQKKCPVSNDNQPARVVQAVNQVPLQAMDEAKKGNRRRAATDHAFVTKMEERSSRRDSFRFEMEGIESRKKRASAAQSRVSEYPRSHKRRYKSMNPTLRPTFTSNPLMRSFSPDFCFAEEDQIGFSNENMLEKSESAGADANDQHVVWDTQPIMQEVALPEPNLTQGQTSAQFAGSTNGFYNRPMPFFPYNPYFGQQNFPMMPSMPFSPSHTGVFPPSPSMPFSPLPSIQQFPPSPSMQPFPPSPSMQPYVHPVQVVPLSSSMINDDQNVTPRQGFVPNFYPASFYGFPIPMQGNGHFYPFPFGMPMPQQNIEPTQENLTKKETDNECYFTN